MVSIKMFISIGQFAPGKRYFKLALPENETIGEVIKQLKVPEQALFLLWHNGINIMQGDDSKYAIERERILKNGDVLALSGSVSGSRCHAARKI